MTRRIRWHTLVIICRALADGLEWVVWAIADDLVKCIAIAYYRQNEVNFRLIVVRDKPRRPSIPSLAIIAISPIATCV